MERPINETDEALAVAAAEGRRAAFEHLVRRHGASVRAVLERVVGDHHEAWDLTQEAWLKVHAALGGFDATRAFRPWLLRITLNLGRDALRRRRRGMARMGVDAAPATAPDPSLALADREEITCALDRVSPPFREAVVLVDVLGLSYEEAAASLECAPGTIKSRVHRGREEFRRHYGRGRRRMNDERLQASTSRALGPDRRRPRP